MGVTENTHSASVRSVSFAAEAPMESGLDEHGDAVVITTVKVPDIVGTAYAAARAARRVRECLDTAERNGHLKHAWYAYMARQDVEALLAYVEMQRAS